jgi:hypothetical protein
MGERENAAPFTRFGSWLGDPFPFGSKGHRARPFACRRPRSVDVFGECKLSCEVGPPDSLSAPSPPRPREPSSRSWAGFATAGHLVRSRKSTFGQMHAGRTV